jgi:hypothetical protein
MEVYLLKQQPMVENEIRVTGRFFSLLFSLCCAVVGLHTQAFPPAPLTDAKLHELVAKSDLIVVASTPTICEECMGSGPIADGVHPTPEYLEFIFPITISRVLKGAGDRSNPLTISYTALVYGPKIAPAPMKFDVGFKIDKTAPRRSIDGAPKPGVSYVFFLQNRKAREPGSYEALGKQEIIYNNFDFTWGMVPVRHADLARIEALAKPG